MKRYYPLMIDLSDRPCVVIGGGKVAERKINSLVEANAKITVVSPKVTERIVELSNCGIVQLVKREYQHGDLSGNFLVIIATNNSSTNKKIYSDVEQYIQLVNIVDEPKLCTFIVPSSIKRGHLQIAISTNGASPGLSRRIKHNLGKIYGCEYEQYTEFLATMREWALYNVKKEDREEYFLDLLTEEKFLKIKNGDRIKLEEELKSLSKRGG